MLENLDYLVLANNMCKSVLAKFLNISHNIRVYIIKINVGMSKRNNRLPK